jgi:DNA-binding HxlR family transcriptional regulator
MIDSKKPGKSACVDRRSPCPVACSLDLLGDKWTLLVVRDLLLGKTTYTEFQQSPEGIPRLSRNPGTTNARSATPTI